MRATVTCPSCTAAWHAGDARFCGTCGASLQHAPPPGPAPGRPWSRMALGLVVAGVAGGTVAGAGSGAFRLPERAADPAVDLAPDDGLTPAGDPLSDSERAAALAPFAEDRLRCEPAGCERWRVDVGSRPTTRLHASVIDDLVVAALGAEVAAYDLDSGAERWRTAWPGAAEAPPAWSDLVVIDEVDGGILVAWPTTGHLLAMDRRGQVLWHAHDVPSGGGHVTPAGDVVVAAQPSGVQAELERDDGREQTFLQLDDLRVLDAGSGDLLWEAASVTVIARLDGSLVLHDGTTARRHDVRTGEEHGRRPMPFGPWLQPADGVLVHAADEEDRTWHVLSADDLAVAAELGPLDLLQPSDDGAVLVGQVRGDSGTGGRVLLFEPDGALRWEHELALPTDAIPTCCAAPQVDGDDLVLPPAAGTTAPLRFDLSDGTLRPAPPIGPGSVPAPGDEPGTWWVNPHTALSRDVDDTDGTTLVWHDGHRVAIRGSFSGPHNLDPPLVFTGWGSMIAVQPVPRD